MSTDDSSSSIVSTILYDYMVPFLTGNFPYSVEFRLFFQGLAVFMAIKKAQNKKHWFHTFCIGLVTAFGGGMFTPIWLGRPSFLIANDLLFGLAALAYAIAFILPFGFFIGQLFPVKLVTTAGSTLFKSTGVCMFASIANEVVQPSKYYPIPVFGPIIWATLLANMGAFFLKGFHKHIENGIPYPAQNALFCATFYHFYVNDATGGIGIMMRKVIQEYMMLPTLMQLEKLEDKNFAVFVVSLFMQLVSILQMNLFFGPTFNPYNIFARKPKQSATKTKIEKDRKKKQ
mmetsp:Transcript_10994/g.12292  ORF Transcript_10994/g.12292 Transcript_10994/m.12292 type:complete len:287 (+) Transcript_10994:235-1095(+)